MKKLVFIHGPNGVGKSTTCELLHNKLINSAWLESEWARRINPFEFNEEIELLTEKNITHFQIIFEGQLSNEYNCRIGLKVNLVVLFFY